MVELLYDAYRAFELIVGWMFSPGWLPPRDFDLLKWLVVPGFGYGIILIGFGIAELLFPAAKRPWSRASALSATYLLFAGKLGFYTLIVAPAMRKGWLYFSLPSLRLDEKLPLPIYMVVGVLAVTFTAYWAHRLMHRIPWFWHIHKVHHSAENLNYSTIYHVHFLEALLQTPLHLTAVLLLGTSLVSPFGVIFTFIDILGHANVRLRTGWLSYLISTPEAHRIHHSKNALHYDRNFGTTFMWWDHAFGTFHYDPRQPATEFGIREPMPAGFFKQQIVPLLDIWRDLRGSLGRPSSRTGPAAGSQTQGN